MHGVFITWTQGDFEGTDEQFCSRSRGGHKRKCPTFEMLIRKSITPNHLDGHSGYFFPVALGGFTGGFVSFFKKKKEKEKS